MVIKLWELTNTFSDIFITNASYSGGYALETNIDYTAKMEETVDVKVTPGIFYKNSAIGVL